MAAGTQGIRAGKAFVELFADPSKLYRALEQAKKRLETAAAAYRAIGAKVGGAGAAILGPLLGIFSRAVEEGANIEKLARRWGMAASAIAELQGAFRVAGISAEGFASILDGLSRKIADATTENAEIIKGLQWFRGRDLFGKDKLEQLRAFFDAFSKIKDKADQFNVAEDFGMTALLPWLRKGRAGLEELLEAQRKTQSGWSAQQAKDAMEIYRQFNLTVQALKGTIIELGKALLPEGATIASFGESIRDALATAREWMIANRGVVVAVAAVGAGLVAAGAAIVGFSLACTAASMIVGGLVIAFKAMMAVIAAICSPIGLAVVAVSALTAGLLYLFSQTSAGAAIFSGIKDAFLHLVSWIKAGWEGITDAISAGDWVLAFKIGVAMAQEAWAALVYKLTQLWVKFKAFFVDNWESAINWVSKKLVGMAVFFGKQIAGMMRGLIKVFNFLAPSRMKIDGSKIPSDEAIEKEGDNVKKNIDDEYKADMKRRDDFRKDQIKRAMDDWNKAYEKLRDLRKEAHDKAHGPKGPGREGGRIDNDIPDFKRNSRFLADNQKGIFTASATQQQLGYGDTMGKRQLDAVLAIKANAGAAVMGINGLGEKIDKLRDGLVFT